MTARTPCICVVGHYQQIHILDGSLQATAQIQTPGHDNFRLASVFNADHIVVDSGLDVVSILNVGTQQIRSTFQHRQTRGVGAVATTSRGLASTPDLIFLGGKKPVGIWNASTGDFVGEFRDRPPNVDVMCLNETREVPEILIAGGAVVGTGDCFSIWVYNMMRQLVGKCHGHNRHVRCLSVCGPDGFYSSSIDNEVKFWSRRRMECVHTFRQSNDERICSLLSVPEKHLLLCGTSQGVIEIWDVRGRKSQVVRKFQPHSQWVNEIRRLTREEDASDESFVFVSGGTSGVVASWNLNGEILDCAFVEDRSRALCLVSTT